MTHYYNLVLDKLSRAEGMELTLVVPLHVSKSLGDNVHQTNEGVSFRVIRLRERSLLGIYHSFHGLARLLVREKPDVIILNESYLPIFFLSLPLRAVVKWLRIKLILKKEGKDNPTFVDIKEFYNTKLHPNVIDFDDQKVYENVFHKGKWAGIFQFDASHFHQPVFLLLYAYP